MKNVGRFLLVAVLMIPLLGTGCAEHRQVYAWTPGEQTYYIQWEHDTHRHHTDYDRRSKADQKAYWKWRKHHEH